MILAELRLDVHNPSVQRALIDCNDMHRNLMKAFDCGVGADPRKTVGLLYRLLMERSDARLLVLSNIGGDWSNLAKNGYTCLRERSVDALIERFHTGARYGFDLVCVPAKKVAGEGKNSKRVSLKTAEERRAWLERKAQDGGFRPIFLMEAGTETVSGRRKGQPFSFTAIRMTGSLEVTDPELFAKTYAEGVGSEKAYGMGMLLLGRDPR